VKDEEKSCCFTHTYSEIEGLQPAYTLRYRAAEAPRGVWLELCRAQDGVETCRAAFCPEGDFAFLARAMQYLSENGAEELWLDVLADLGVRCEPVERDAFCGFCQN